MGRTLADLVATLAADPRHGAVVCDIDGTLAPIAPTPEQATVLPAALPELERLVDRYTLVACVTGRPAVQARRMVPIAGVAISGNHGLEVMHGNDVTVVPQAARYLDAVREALLVVENDGLLPELGCRVEDKGITFTVHYRGSAVRRLRGRKRITNLMYVGDDRTDLDAFREATIKIAVRSAEGPPELIEQADACVDGPEQVVALLAPL